MVKSNDMSIENGQPSFGFTSRKPFEQWESVERERLLRAGMTELGLTVYKVVTAKDGVLVSPQAQCKFGCEETVWTPGTRTFEEHSLMDTKAGPGLHSRTFEDRLDFIFHLNQRSGYLALLLLEPQHYLGMGLSMKNNHVKASEYKVLDSLRLGSDKSRDVKRAFFSGPRRTKVKRQVRNDKIYKIGSESRSWDDVIRILSET